MRGVLLAALLGLTGAAAAPDFSYQPQPRWAEDPDTDMVCAAIRAECAGALKDDQIEAEWSYAELYNSDGMLVGLRSLQSSGCKPLDEHLLLSHHHFCDDIQRARQARPRQHHGRTFAGHAKGRSAADQALVDAGVD